MELAKDERQGFVFVVSCCGGGCLVPMVQHDVHNKYLDEYINQNLFIGCDQQILSTLYMNHKELFNLITPDNKIIDKWFYLYHYFSIENN